MNVSDHFLMLTRLGIQAISDKTPSFGVSRKKRFQKYDLRKRSNLMLVSRLLQLYFLLPLPLHSLHDSGQPRVMYLNIACIDLCLLLC